MTAAAKPATTAKPADVLIPIPMPGMPGIPGSWLTSGASAAGAVDGMAKVVALLGSVIVKAASWLANPHNWLRILYTVAGSAACLAGLVMLANSGVGGPVAGAGAVASKAAGLVPAGRAVKIARTLTK